MVMGSISKKPYVVWYRPPHSTWVAFTKEGCSAVIAKAVADSIPYETMVLLMGEHPNGKDVGDGVSLSFGRGEFVGEYCYDALGRVSASSLGGSRASDGGGGSWEAQ